MNFEKALLDPSRAFATPLEVCETSELTRQQKVEILRRWEYDARELQVAADENMTGSDSVVSLDDVLAALHQLGEGAHTEDAPPTKQ